MRYSGTGMTSRLVRVDGVHAVSLPCWVVMDHQAEDAESPTLVLGGDPGAPPAPMPRTIAYCDRPEDAERIAALLNATDLDPEYLNRCVARLESMGDQFAAALVELRRVVPREAT